MSRPSNMLFWSRLSSDARSTRLLATRGGFIAGILYWLIAAASYSGSSNFVTVSLQLGLTTLVMVFVMLIVIPCCAAVWLTAQNPARSRLEATALTIGNTFLQFLIFAAMGYMVNFLVRTFG